jgi:hypothetical protein
MTQQMLQYRFTFLFVAHFRKMSDLYLTLRFDFRLHASLFFTCYLKSLKNFVGQFCKFNIENS